MGVASVLVGVLALLMMFAGIFLAWRPGAGSLLSFGAPLVALVGAVLGGMAMSRAKQEGGSSGAGLAGLIVSIVAFLLGLVFALTCGLCNALFTAEMVKNRGRLPDGGVMWRVDRGTTPPWRREPDGGVGAMPSVPDEPAALGDTPPPGDAPSGGTVDAVPPPAFPPPPPLVPAPEAPEAPESAPPAPVGAAPAAPR
jgi:hypothetical protein